VKFNSKKLIDAHEEKSSKKFPYNVKCWGRPTLSWKIFWRKNLKLMMEELSNQMVLNLSKILVKILIKKI
jgi:hypothetical protein